MQTLSFTRVARAKHFPVSAKIPVGMYCSLRPRTYARTKKAFDVEVDTVSTPHLTIALNSLLSNKYFWKLIGN